jgi:hypothetical protein
MPACHGQCCGVVDHHGYNECIGKTPKTMNDNNQNPSSTEQPKRRARQRIKVKVPIELFPPDSDVPQRGATSDLSEIPCYIETMFPFPVGTTLEMSLQLDGTLVGGGQGGELRPAGRKWNRVYQDAAGGSRGTAGLRKAAQQTE